MSKDKTIYTCYGCPLYYATGNGLHSYPTRHCDYDDHWKCSYFRGETDIPSFTVKDKEGD